MLPYNHRDSPLTNGQGRRESVEYQYYGMPVAPQQHQGFVGGNPARSRPSPKRSQSPQDLGQHSPAIAAFPSHPVAPSSQRRGTPQGQQNTRRTSADRRANNSPTSAQQPVGIGPSGIHAYVDRKFVTGIPMAGTPTGTWGGPGASVNGGRGGILGTPERRELPTVQNTVGTPGDSSLESDKMRLEEALKSLCVKHLDRAPASEMETIVDVMTKVEAMFWSYLETHVKSAAGKPGMRKFEKGLLKEFTVEILRLRPHLCGLWPDAPLGGVDTGKDEINKKKVAELFHRTFCEHKMAQPVAGAVVLSQDLKKMLMVRNRLCTVGWALPKKKCPPAASPTQCAIAAVHELTGYSVASRLPQNTPKVEIEIDRGVVKQPQTLFIIPGVPEAEVATRANEIEWKPLATMPYLDTLVNPKSEILKLPVEYESIAVFLKKLKQPLSRMITNLKAGLPLEGPAFDVANMPMTRIFDFHAAKKRLLARDNRWLAAAFTPSAKLPSEDKIAQQRNALQIKLSQDLIKALA